eukprot:scaffold4891_cov140-Cylindrotheca_fusiformis.AAC.7
MTSSSHEEGMAEEVSSSGANPPPPSSLHERDEIQSSTGSILSEGQSSGEDSEDANLPRWRRAIRSLAGRLNTVFFVLTYPFMVIITVAGLLVVIAFCIFPTFLLAVLIVCVYYCLMEDPIPLPVLIRHLLSPDDEDLGQSDHASNLQRRYFLVQHLTVRKLLNRQNRKQDEEETKEEERDNVLPISIVTEHVHLDFSGIVEWNRENVMGLKENSSFSSSSAECSAVDEETGIALQQIEHSEDTLRTTEQQDEEASPSLELPTGSDDDAPDTLQPPPAVELASSSSESSPKETNDVSSPQEETSEPVIEESPATTNDDCGGSMSDRQDRGTICDICLDDFKVGDSVAWSPNMTCPHCFHKECILDWLMRNKTCPSCRKDYLVFRTKDGGQPEVIRPVRFFP